jgi:hypothetical protein
MRMMSNFFVTLTMVMHLVSGFSTYNTARRISLTSNSFNYKKTSTLSMSESATPLTDLCHISKEACEAVSPMLQGK